MTTTLAELKSDALVLVAQTLNWPEYRAALECFRNRCTPDFVLALIERLETADLNLRLTSASLSAVKEALRQSDVRLEKLEAVAKASRVLLDNETNIIARSDMREALAALEAP